MSDNTAKKTNPAFTPAQASLMAEQLRSKQGNDPGPLSSPGLEQLLPGDDLSMFFRNRAVTAVGFGWGTFFKRILILLLLVAGFIGAYNYQPKFRKFANTQSRQWLDLDLQKYVPKVNIGRKKAKKAVTSKSTVAAGAPQTAKAGQAAGKPVVLLDRRVWLVRGGQWGEVEAQLRNSCTTWVASPECALKGFVLASKGLGNSARAMTKVSDSSVQLLKPADRVVWYLASALILGSADTDRRKFKAALDAAGPSSSETKRAVFDELIVTNAVARRPGDVGYFMNLAAKDPMARYWATAFIKWRSLDMVIRTGSITPAMISEILKNDKGSLRSDPRAFEILIPAIIRVGQADKIAPISIAAAADAMQSKMEPSVTRRVLASHLRVLWANGRRSDASAALANYVSKGGWDPFSRHFQSAAVFQNGSSEQAAKSLALLSGVGQSSPWETKYLKGFALIRSGQPQKAVPFIQSIAKNPRNQTQALWVKLLKAEYLVSQRRYAEAQALVQPMLTSPNLPLLAYEILHRAYNGLGKEHEAATVRLKIDDVKSKTGYSSSPEMLGSPLGPLALLR